MPEDYNNDPRYNEFKEKLEEIRRMLPRPNPAFDTAPTKMEPEPKLEPELYEDYRAYPVIITVNRKQPEVWMDSGFMNTCYDFGRMLALYEIDPTDGYKEAEDFVEKLVLSVEGKKIIRTGTQWEKDTIATRMGLAFVNRGFVNWKTKLTTEKSMEYIVATIDNLRSNGILNY